MMRRIKDMGREAEEALYKEGARRFLRVIIMSADGDPLKRHMLALLQAYNTISLSEHINFSELEKALAILRAWATKHFPEQKEWKFAMEPAMYWPPHLREDIEA